jgi:hypothetical protein
MKFVCRLDTFSNAQERKRTDTQPPASMSLDKLRSTTTIAQGDCVWAFVEEGNVANMRIDKLVGFQIRMMHKGLHSSAVLHVPSDCFVHTR